MDFLITCTFNYKGQRYKEECLTSALDSNYDDENYAYFLREKEIDGEKSLFEINIIKNAHYLTMKGYVNVFLSEDDNEPTDIIKCDISFSVVYDFYFQAYPKMITIKAINKDDALERYRQQHPDDTRNYYYTGNARRTFVIQK